VLGRRIATALVLAPLIFGVIFFLPYHYAAAFFGLMYLIGAWEWAGFLQTGSPWTKAGFVFVAGLAMALFATLGAWGHSLWVLGAAVPAWLLGLSWILRYPMIIPRWMCAAFGLVIIGLAWFAVTILLDMPRGPQWVLFAFCIVWLADTGAYFVGRTLGRHKLAVRVSPGKTWEGVAGGMAASAAVGYAGSIWFELPPGVLVPLVLICGTVSVIGDLTVSVFKRESGLKDSGWILPGHGGILDRMDSLTAAAPILALGLELAGFAG
jgi:phosphatidate cytidylyltransferase